MPLPPRYHHAILCSFVLRRDRGRRTERLGVPQFHPAAKASPMVVAVPARGLVALPPWLYASAVRVRELPLTEAEAAKAGTVGKEKNADEGGERGAAAAQAKAHGAGEQPVIVPPQAEWKRLTVRQPPGTAAGDTVAIAVPEGWVEVGGPQLARRSHAVQLDCCFTYPTRLVAATSE
eukprot:SAG25_NODE_397_length_8510_cov_7.345619_9_plen_177_part_00